jgi:hypothetical protein
MLTKTQLEIMKVFVSKITERFSIKQISEILKKPYPLIHRSIKSLIVEKFIIKDKQNFLSLNYKKNHSTISYVESLRKDSFLRKNKTITLFVNDALKKIKADFFILLIFGSAVDKQKPRDVDILMIFKNSNKNREIETILNNIASNFSKDFDINVLTVESVYEMLSKRDNKNLMNETLNKHILIFGSENYYRLLENAR